MGGAFRAVPAARGEPEAAAGAALPRAPVPRVQPRYRRGRGFLFAQFRDDRGRLMDLGTKGSEGRRRGAGSATGG